MSHKIKDGVQFVNRFLYSQTRGDGCPNPLLSFSRKSANLLKTRPILNYRPWSVSGRGRFRNESRMDGQSKAFMLKAFKMGLPVWPVPQTTSRFREGDLVILHRDNPKDKDALHFDLQYDGELELDANLIRGNEVLLFANPGGWIMDQDWFDTSPFYLSALDKVANSQLGRSTILPLLQSTLTPKIDYARYERAKETLNDTGLNESQVESVAMSYATDLLHLIQGPPGTGKTLMLAHLAKLLVLGWTPGVCHCPDPSGHP